jgi:SAM-dependent methyltransferase
VVVADDGAVTRSGPGEAWSSGDAYDGYVGRWSRVVAHDFVAWLKAAPGGRWLDVGTGTGALSAAVFERAAPVEVVGVDRSAEYVAAARRRLPHPRARFEVGDAGESDALMRGAPFDVAVAGLVLNFLPDPAATVGAMRRAVRPGGTVAAYVWDYAGRMEMMRCFWDAAGRLDRAAGDLDEGRRFPLCDPEPLAALWSSAGLGSVATTAIDAPTRFADFGDYWAPFLGGQGPAPGYVMSLPDERRVALRDAVRAALPVAPDGSISLVARAWAVRGTVP